MGDKQYIHLAYPNGRLELVDEVANQAELDHMVKEWSETFSTDIDRVVVSSYPLPDESKLAS